MTLRGRRSGKCWHAGVLGDDRSEHSRWWEALIGASCDDRPLPGRDSGIHTHHLAIEGEQPCNSDYATSHRFWRLELSRQPSPLRLWPPPHRRLRVIPLRFNSPAPTWAVRKANARRPAMCRSTTRLRRSITSRTQVAAPKRLGQPYAATENPLSSEGFILVVRKQLSVPGS